MSDIVIRVEHLGKRYKIGSRSDGRFQYKALRDTLTDALYAPFCRVRTKLALSKVEGLQRANIQRGNLPTIATRIANYPGLTPSDRPPSLHWQYMSRAQGQGKCHDQQ